MEKTVYASDDFKVVNSKNEYVLVNLNGEHRHHAHLKKADTCFLLMKLIRKKIVPQSKYLQEAAIRLSTDDDYIKKIRHKQEKNRNKEQYYNVNKGL